MSEMLLVPTAQSDQLIWSLTYYAPAEQQASGAILAHHLVHLQGLLDGGLYGVESCHGRAFPIMLWVFFPLWLQINTSCL